MWGSSPVQVLAWIFNPAGFHIYEQIFVAHRCFIVSTACKISYEWRISYLESLDAYWELVKALLSQGYYSGTKGLPLKIIIKLPAKPSQVIPVMSASFSIYAYFVLHDKGNRFPLANWLFLRKNIPAPKDDTSFLQYSLYLANNKTYFKSCN